jgi:hypothetical protein
MTKLQELLDQLGLQQYAGVLVENDIDLEVLSDLTESDLEKLGLSFGHRRKLLKALAALQPAPSQPETPPAPPTSRTASTLPTWRKQNDFCRSSVAKRPHSGGTQIGSAYRMRSLQ